MNYEPEYRGESVTPVLDHDIWTCCLLSSKTSRAEPTKLSVGIENQHLAQRMKYDLSHTKVRERVKHH
jgi:hypothetical protein